MSAVVFLGAGASKEFGFPLTRELLPRMLELLANETLFRSNSDRSNEECSRLHDAHARLRKGLEVLLPGAESLVKRLEPSGEKFPVGVGDLLSIVDFCLLESQPLSPNWSLHDLERFRNLLEGAIINVIADGSETKGDSGVKKLDFFLEWLKELNGENAENPSIVSTNYDIAVELGIFTDIGGVNLAEREAKVASAFDFGFSWRSPEAETIIHSRPPGPQWRFYKLHGSFNWLRCSLCSHTYVNVYGAITHQAFRDEYDDYNTCHCGHRPLSTSIISPSLVREVKDPNLLEIWKSAFEELRTAEQWFLIGYSLPTEDIAIRSMLLRAYRARETEPKVVVVQKGTEAKGRFELLFPGCTYHEGGLESFLKSQQSNKQG